MTYKAKKFDHLIGTEGFSDILLKNHFTLYEGYVTNTNTLIEKVGTTVKGTPEYAEIKRRFGWEFNGMRLHELYFGAMTKDGTARNGDTALVKKLTEDFGSPEAWEEDFRATGALRGIGWTILAYDKDGERLFNVWINEHNAGHLAGATPIVVLDVFEHAFMIDYGLKRADYIAAFMKAINWEEVERRFIA